MIELLWSIHRALARAEQPDWPPIDEQVAEYIFTCNARLLAVQIEACENIIRLCNFPFSENKSKESFNQCKVARGLFLHQNNTMSSSQQDWSYEDPQGVIQGPFSSDVMQEWLTQGYFDSTTMFFHGPCGQCRLHEKTAFQLGKLESTFKCVTLSNKMLKRLKT